MDILFGEESWRPRGRGSGMTAEAVVERVMMLATTVDRQTGARRHAPRRRITRFTTNHTSAGDGHNREGSRT